MYANKGTANSRRLDDRLIIAFNYSCVECDVGQICNLFMKLFLSTTRGSIGSGVVSTYHNEL